MRTSFILIYIILICLKVSAQDKRLIINGNVSIDSVPLENIHIINKSSRKATISDKNGAFQIPVKKNDTLLVSSIQFKNELIIINHLNISTLSLLIKLKLKITSLDEVTVRKPTNIAQGLGIPNAGKKPLNKIESNLNAHTKSSLPVAILTTLLNKRGGFNDMLYILSGKRKKDRKLNQLRERDKYEKHQVLQIQKFRMHLKDSFFTKTLKIPFQNINDFIMYCRPTGVVDMYLNGRKIEAIDLLIQQSEPYLKELTDEN